MPKERKLLTQGQSPGLTAEGKDPIEQLSASATTAVYIEKIQSRAHTITPLLKELLELRPPPHWGINE